MVVEMFYWWGLYRMNDRAVVMRLMQVDFMGGISLVVRRIRQLFCRR